MHVESLSQTHTLSHDPDSRVVGETRPVVVAQADPTTMMASGAYASL